MNSKWNYIAVGLNMMLAFVGALWHSMSVLLMGIGFGIFNYYVAESNRRIEDEQIRKADSEIQE